MIWNVPEMWKGGECWIIGGGPSIPYEFGVPEDVIEAVQNGELPIDAYSPYLSPIHDKHVIAVNAAFLLGTWPDMMFFVDAKFYWANQAALRVWPKPKITTNPTLKKFTHLEKIKLVTKDAGKPSGINTKKNVVSWNRNSGAAAINLAYHLGCERVYLLGFDMDIGGHQNQHWHRHYLQPGKKKDLTKLPFKKHIPMFRHVAADAKILGLKIINVSQMSTLKDFEKKTVKEILGE